MVTIINVFTVEPANQAWLVELLSKVTNDCVRHARGFVASSLHRSLDGTKVTMYGQWRSMADYEAMRKDGRLADRMPGFHPHRQADGVEPGVAEHGTVAARRDADDAAVEIEVERQPVAALLQQPREAAADVAESDERKVSAHGRRRSRGTRR